MATDRADELAAMDPMEVAVLAGVVPADSIAVAVVKVARYCALEVARGD